MNGHFFNVQRILKNGQKPDLSAANFEQHFKYTMSHMDLRKFIMIKVVKKLNPIV